MPSENYGRLEERLTVIEEMTEEHEEAIKGRDGLNIRMDRAERMLLLLTRPILWITVTLGGAALTVYVTIKVYAAMGVKT